MLLRFVVENLFCFGEEALFSMVATKDASHPNHRIKAGGVDALRVTALYGANAHGKTRLIHAMNLAKTFITEGFKPRQPIPVKPFLLDSRFHQQPSRFEFTFMVRGIEYTYGFVCDTKRFHEEWLFSRPNKREVMLFERVTNAEGTSEFNIGKTLVRNRTEDNGLLGFLKKGVPENQLFLTYAVANNFAVLKPVFDWFYDQLVIILVGGFPKHLPDLIHSDESFRVFTGRFLQTADTGIVSVKTKKEILILDDVLKDVPEHIRERIEKDIFDGELNKQSTLSRTEIVAGHNTSDGEIVDFPMQDESSGTIRLLELFPILYQSNTEEKVYVLDELDRTLHPSLSRLFLETFLNLSSDNKNQLIFTTHESNLLDLDLLRRDEIWFVEKDTDGKSHLYPLSSMKIRPDVNIKRGYLHGRFGAIPFIGSTAALGWNSPGKTHKIGEDIQGKDLQED